MENEKHTIHTFWHNPALDNHVDETTRLCIKSMSLVGHQVKVWSYGQLRGLEGIDIEHHDANEILSQDKFFTADYGPMHGYAYFSDLFRYELLRTNSGWWLDTDVILLQSPDDLVNTSTEIAFARERTDSKGHRLYNGAILYGNGMSENRYIQSAIKTCSQVSSSNTSWGVIGPKLLTDMAEVKKGEPGIELISRNAFYFNGYLDPDLARWAYTELEQDDADIILSLMETGMLYGVHLWNALVDWDRIHPKSYYGRLLGLMQLPADKISMDYEDFRHTLFGEPQFHSQG